MVPSGEEVFEVFHTFRSIPYFLCFFENDQNRGPILVTGVDFFILLQSFLSQ